uniref:glutamine--fructose-6-phosphate transaminase (isomerizing) n=1 Tax=Zonotrichia albicollis TaxID=44394 RepID=A0A8D2MLF3_ZONAL
MCIFAYLNYHVPRTRREILETLIKGLQRLEYRGYDSAGVGLDGGNDKDWEANAGKIHIIKQTGKVKALDEEVHSKCLPFLLSLVSGLNIPCFSHKHEFPEKSWFFQNLKYIVGNRKNSKTTTKLLELGIEELEGAFALVFKSVHYPGQAVGTRRGSPLLIGVRSEHKLSTDHIPILYRTACCLLGKDKKGSCNLSRVDSTTCLFPVEEKAVEYYFASDASAVIEHTNRVIFLEDDDVAAVVDGRLSIHRVKRTAGDHPGRAVQTLQMELQQIMKGNFSSFMQKEIFEQPESVVNTMRGRVNFDDYTARLGLDREGARGFTVPAGSGGPWGVSTLRLGFPSPADLIKEVLSMDDEIQKLATELYHQKSVLIMGRGYHYATCLEGALKIKEITYMHSEGILAGELKHGPLALVDKLMPVIMIIMRDHTYAKCQNALQQVIARQGRPVVICDKEDIETIKNNKRTIKVPHSVDCLQGILSVIPLQLLPVLSPPSLQVDFPRNLAKSVTVE